MKNVVVPPSVTFVNKDGTPATVTGQDGKPQNTVSMYDFVMDSVCASPEIGKGIEGVKRVRKLQRAFEDTKPGDIVGIEDADYTVAMKVIENIQWARPIIAMQLLPMMEAWENAAKQDEDWKKNNNLKSV